MAADPSPEFQDWELLLNSDSDAADSPNSDHHLEETEANSEGVLRLDHFSLDNDNRLANSVTVDASVGSDNPSWIEPGSETRSQTHRAAEFWSDSGSDRSVDLGVSDNQKSDIELLGFDETVKSFEEFGRNQSADKDSAVLAESEIGESSEGANLSGIKRGGCDEEKRKAIWWKVPLELLKYCALRISPVWTFSMAAAAMGFAILGLRLYKMKRKARSLQLKVTVDDKKVSQFARHAARLNEAFSVPMVRPLLPAASGLNSWPVMNLR